LKFKHYNNRRKKRSGKNLRRRNGEKLKKIIDKVYGKFE